MKYLMLMYGAENSWTDAERTACMAESLKVCDDLKARRQYLDAAPLHPVATAATVRVRNGQTFVTAGPFAETTEQLGGYYVLDLPDLDAAIAVAERLPPAKKGTVEIRPIVEPDGLPAPTPAEAAADPDSLHLLLAYHVEADLEAVGEDGHRDMMAEAVGHCRERHARGGFLSAAPLKPAATATCVRVRDGKRFVTDGPFAETREILAGYYLIRAADTADAVAFAALQPGARLGSIEVRRVFDLSPLRKY